MTSAADIHGAVFKNGSAIFLARVLGADGDPIAPTDITAAKYTVYLLDENDPDASTAISGHTDVAVAVAALIESSLQTGELWQVDTTGYNFKHELDVSASQAFAAAGRHYRIVFELTPYEGQVIQVRFRVHAI